MLPAQVTFIEHLSCYLFSSMLKIRDMNICCHCYLVLKSCPIPLWHHGLLSARFLCPWDFPGKNTGVGCHFLLQGIFLTQGSNPGLPHCRRVLYLLSHKRSPKGWTVTILHLLSVQVTSVCPQTVTFRNAGLSFLPRSIPSAHHSTWHLVGAQ